MLSPFTFIHAPTSFSRSTEGAGIRPSPVGPTFSRKLPPLLVMSIRLRTSVSVGFHSVVRLVEAPVLVQRHAGLPGLRVAALRDLLLLHGVVAQAVAHPRVDDAGRLQLAIRTGTK